MALLTVTIPTRTYQVGSANIASSAVPVSAEEMVLTLDVTSWTNPAIVVDVAMEMSLDGGATWVPAGRAPLQSRADGTWKDYRGNVITAVSATFGWPSGVTHVRGEVIVSGANVRTGGTVVVN